MRGNERKEEGEATERPTNPPIQTHFCFFPSVHDQKGIKALTNDRINKKALRVIRNLVTS